MIFIPLWIFCLFFIICLLLGRLLRDVFDPALEQFFDLDLALDIFKLENPERLLFEHELLLQALRGTLRDLEVGLGELIVHLLQVLDREGKQLAGV